MYLQAGAAFASEQGLETDLQDDPRQGIRRIHGCCTGQIEFNVTEGPIASIGLSMERPQELWGAEQTECKNRGAQTD